MKYKSVLMKEAHGSLRPGKFASKLTARQLAFNRSSFGKSTAGSYALFPKQKMQRLHYAMACAKWGTLNDGQKAAYQTYADENDISLFNSFVHSYLAELRSDLVLYLAMDKIIDSTVKDYSPAGNDGTNHGATFTKEGFLDGALDFDGTDDYVDCGAGTSLYPTDAITVELWFSGVATKRSPVYSGGFSYITKKGIRISAFHSVDDKHARITMCDGVAAESVFGDDEIPENIWTHIAGTMDGETLRGYINGVKQTDEGPLTSIAYENNVTHIGESGGDEYSGIIDEVRVYKRVLTAAEIKALYDQETKWHFRPD